MPAPAPRHVLHCSPGMRVAARLRRLRCWRPLLHASASHVLRADGAIATCSDLPELPPCAQCSHACLLLHRRRIASCRLARRSVRMLPAGTHTNGAGAGQQSPQPTLRSRLSSLRLTLPDAGGGVAARAAGALLDVVSTAAAAAAQRVRLGVAQAKAARTLAALAHGEVVILQEGGRGGAARKGP